MSAQSAKRQKITYSKESRPPPATPPATQSSPQQSSLLFSVPPTPPSSVPRALPLQSQAFQSMGQQKAGLRSLQQWKAVQKSAAEEEDAEDAVESDDEELEEIFARARGVFKSSTYSAPVGPLSALSRDNLSVVKQQWKGRLDGGISTLARAVMKEEIDARLIDKSALNTADVDWTAQVMEDNLHSTEHALLEAVMLKNLSLEKRNNPNLKAILDAIWKQAEHQPSIYHRMLVDGNGTSPTASDLDIAANIMLGYMEGCDEDETEDIANDPNRIILSTNDVYAIDTFRGYRKTALDKTKSAGKSRKYMYNKPKVTKKNAPAAVKGKGKGKAPVAPLSGSSSSDSDSSSAAKTKKTTKKGTSTTTCEEKYCPARVMQTIAFVDALRKPLGQIPKADWTKPLEFPLIEVGCSNRSIARLKAHKAHTFSNYIINLMEAIFGAVPQRFRGIFAIEQEIIYLIWRIEQAEISGIGWTKLAEGYIHNAGGSLPGWIEQHFCAQDPLA